MFLVIWLDKTKLGYYAISLCVPARIFVLLFHAYYCDNI